MTKKDYKAIAKILADNVPLYDTTGEQTWDRIAYALANLFQEDNDKFNRAKFFNAIGYDDYLNRH